MDIEDIIYPKNINPALLYTLEKHIEKVESHFRIELSVRGSKIMFKGNDKQRALFKKYFNQLIELTEQKNSFSENDLKLSLNIAEHNEISNIRDQLDQKIKITVNGKSVFPKTYMQNEYIKKVMKDDLVFSLGPAGTGKTFLAITLALHHLLTKKVERIVLTRPVVEAGEKLGFLPGDIQQKVNPYFRPVYDSLYYLIGFEKTSELIEKNIIEIAPLAYMRGRTINNAFIILDEGQNTLNSQMKMFLTRFGENSKVVVTADVSQIDLDDSKKSGIFKAIKILRGIKGISIVNLSVKDVVRHSLVQKIITAYSGESDKRYETKN